MVISQTKRQKSSSISRNQSEPTNFHEPTTSKVLWKDIRRDIRKFISDLAKETGTPAKQHKMKDLYDQAKKLARKKSYTSKPLKGTNTVTH